MEQHLTDEGLLEAVGERLTELRLARNLTQAQLAEQAGLGLRTVQRLESGAAATQLSGFFRICHVLGVLDRLDLLLPAPAPSPIEQLKMRGKKRQRVRPKKTTPGTASKWTWSEES